MAAGVFRNRLLLLWLNHNITKLAGKKEKKKKQNVQVVTLSTQSLVACLEKEKGEEMKVQLDDKPLSTSKTTTLAL